ncbi:alkaline phosphatase D family protein [Gynuella sunshinyii]|nr:alkaline phosphatase D family protein [Gynuella sunshinyii]
MPIISRRRFLQLSAHAAGSIYVTYAFVGCAPQDDDDDSAPATPSEALGRGTFEHGVASGDPLSDSVILWTRVTPENPATTAVVVEWQVYAEADTAQVIAQGRGEAKLENDFTVKVDIRGLSADTRYRYQFRTANHDSTQGHTRTLPSGSASQLKMAVLSCSNYPAGYFHVYQSVAQIEDLDLVLHLGDYIYEYGADGYATDDAEAMGRVPQPAGDLVSLEDYRTRYAQYRTDTDLQQAHAKTPFILVWDDHEVANDSWKAGAENHSIEQGDYMDRRAAAFKAYFEWLPIRPVNADSDSLMEPTSIYRQFVWGDLVNLLMLDTRHEARDQQLDLTSFYDPATQGINTTALSAAINNEERQLLGSTQLDWLQNAMSASKCTWQILGQQILMGRMYLPYAIVTQAMTISEYAELAQLAVLAQRLAVSDPSLTAEQIAYVQANQSRLTDQVMALLQAPSLPYNLDAWDGYGAERERLLAIAQTLNVKLISLAGDTHNAWASRLTNANGEVVGVELATASVSSPGLEVYLNIDASDYAATEAGIVSLVEDLQYMNTGDRGWLLLSISHDEVVADWQFVSSVKTLEFELQKARQKQLKVTAIQPDQLQEIEF